ncbi:hypothetical protein BGZ96_001349 [Linnemannia gamsii]|uniref:HCP-like protein n=1 Tax=Linnemannia gamsii TaxID=64522 RepID=A0ABQ7KAV5_9FUNG|nr:hypothetical protein BGZ96_001349 [Linnemannia gamsii]
MDNDKPQVQAIRSVSKDSLDSPKSTPAPTAYFDCHVNPATGKGFVLWDDIRLVFPDALYVRQEAKVVPFTKDAELMPLKPLRIAAVLEVVLDIVVDSPLVHLGAVLQQSSLDDTLIEQPTAKHSAVDTTPKRNPVYGLEETAMNNYSHIDHPGFGPRPRAPQFIPIDEQGEDADKTAVNPDSSKRGSEPINFNSQATIAVLGDTISQVDLGILYRTGDRVEQDYEAARYWLLKAANQGNPSAQSNLGDLYRLGFSVEVDFSTAFFWYNKAANKGDADGQYRLELMHDYGLIGPPDFSEAMDWYLKAANQGHASAQCSIGDLHAHGEGVPQDNVKAMEWYLRAAKLDSPRAQLKIGVMYRDGHGVSKDRTVAIDWLCKAASRKDSDEWAQFAKGLMYDAGLGVPRNDGKAFIWYHKAAR